MELKTKIQAEDGKQDLLITRVFNLPVELLFKAYTEADLVEQWMGTKVLKMDSRMHGSYLFITTDPMGNKHGFNGTIHELVTNEKITRTFQMENTEFPVQLEFLNFESIDEDKSKLTMHFVYKSVEWRDAMLKLPFEYGINMAHDRLEEITSKLKF